MSNTAEKISITVTPAMKRTLEERVASGEFASASELMREAFRVWQKREDEHQEQLASIRARIQKSLDDPRPSLSLEESRAAFQRHAEARTKS
ncbi:MAG: ribbon-helix-helix domain-containing protein [Rhizobiaceae bacterium]